MVNFNNDITYTRPSNDVNKMIVIESDHYVLDALEDYHKQRFNGQTPTIGATLKARIIRLFEAIKYEFMKHADKEDKEKVTNLLHMDREYNYHIDTSKEIKEEVFLKLYNIISKFLNEKRIKEVVNARGYDSSNPIDEDEAKGI
jgi:hypothetical protein